MTTTMSPSQAALFSNPSNYLVYLIADQLLYGTVNGKQFSLTAFSGGGRGSIGNANADFSAASFDPRIAKQSNEFGERGGPLPPGHYLVGVTENNKT